MRDVATDVDERTIESYRSEYPSLVAYWRGLPNGWDSYPQCRVRDAVIEAFRRRGVFAEIPALPAPLAALARGPSDDGWVYEVRHAGLFLATRDRHFRHATDAEFADFWLQVGKERVDRLPEDNGGPIHVTGGRGALERAAALWRANHRGTELACDRFTEREAELTLTHPRGLIPEGLLDVYARSIALLLAREDAVVSDVRVMKNERSAGDADRAITTFVAAWT